MNQKLTIAETKYLRILARKHILLPTKHKKPLVKNWNKFYVEYRGIEKLLELNQEYSLRTGTLIGIHRYLLIKELPKSCWLLNSNGNRIGEIHSKGRFVVGIGSIHEKGTRYTLKGKKGLENIRDLELYEKKLNKPKPSTSEKLKGLSGKEN
nr:2858_t:CDS:2 [Entrophospora candida]